MAAITGSGRFPRESLRDIETCLSVHASLFVIWTKSETRILDETYRAEQSQYSSICDQTISLDGFYTRQDYPELLRRCQS